MGNVKADCYKLKNKNERESKDAANVDESAKPFGDNYVLFVFNFEGVDSQIFDNRATFHKSSKQDYFLSFRDYTRIVLLGDDYALNIYEIGSVHLRMMVLYLSLRRLNSFQTCRKI